MAELPRRRKQQKNLIESVEFLRGVRLSRCSTSPGLIEEELEETREKKILKVAVVGRPNAGKSTLINSLLNLNLCGVSCKTHTTRTLFRTAVTRGDTQIVFMDTPGLITQKEYKRFNLSDAFLTWKETVLREADIIGVVHEAYSPQCMFKLHLNLKQNIHYFHKSKPLFLVLSKIDLVLDKEFLCKVRELFSQPLETDRVIGDGTLPQVWTKFSKIFFTSSKKGTGLNDVANYLLEQAKPGDWMFRPGEVYRKPLHLLVKELLRSRFLDKFPNVIPYTSEYEVEYLKENSLGEIHCVTLITCELPRHARYIARRKQETIKTLAKELESDLYAILGKVFRIRVIVQSKEQ